MLTTIKLNGLQGAKFIIRNSSVEFWASTGFELLALTSLLKGAFREGASDVRVISLNGLKIGDIYRLVVDLFRASERAEVNTIFLVDTLPPLLTKLAEENGICLIPGRCSPAVLNLSVGTAIRQLRPGSIASRKSQRDLMSPMEFSVLKMLLQTESMPETLRRIGGNEKTVYGYRQRALNKLGFSSLNTLVAQGHWLCDFIVRDSKVASSCLCNKTEHPGPGVRNLSCIM